MRKNEMSEKQLGERALVVRTLAGAGWQDSGFEQAFEEGQWLYNEAGMEYANDSMTLRLNYDAEKERVELALYSHSGRGLDLLINFGGKLRELLDLVVSFQDDISPRNYKQYVRKIVQVCPETFASLGPEGDRIVRVTDADVKLS